MHLKTVSAGKDVNSRNDLKEKVRETFKVELPSDFFDFWDFCKNLKGGNPCGKSAFSVNTSFIYLTKNFN